MNKLGCYLTEHRAVTGLKQYEVADKIGLSRSSYSNIENGRQGVGVESLVQLSKILLFSLKDCLNVVYEIDIALSKEELKLNMLEEKRAIIDSEINELRLKLTNHE